VCRDAGVPSTDLVPPGALRGGIEPIVPPRWAAEATGLLPRGELTVLPGAPHNSVYAAADRLARPVEDFLDRNL
jgi:pimeloyl-ACP methyl ester carboxylesterase